MSRQLSNAEVAEVYRAYGHLLLRRCRIILRDDALADDALQNTFVKVMRYGQALNNVDSKLAWLYRVADSCCFDLLGKRKRRKEDFTDVEPAAANEQGTRELQGAVLSFLERLSASDRSIAVFAFVDGLHQGEIATRTGFSRQSINKKLQRIRNRAQKYLRSNHV